MAHYQKPKRDAKVAEVRSSSDAVAAKKPPAPKQCEEPRLARPAPDDANLATETMVTLMIQPPDSVTPISQFEVELYDELTSEKLAVEKIEDTDLWTMQAGSFEYTLQQSLDKGKPYSVKVLAVGTGARQKGHRSRPLIFSTPKPWAPPPERPARPTADVVDQTQVVASFTPPKSVAPITQVQVLYREDNELFQDSEDWDELDVLWKDPREWKPNNPFIESFEPVEPGTTYVIKWRVRSEEWSEYSEELSVRTKPAEPSLPAQAASPAGPAFSSSSPIASAAPKKAAPEVCKAPTQVSSSQEQVTIEITKPKSQTAVQLFEILIRKATSDEEKAKKIDAAEKWPKKWQNIEDTSLWQDLLDESTFTYALTGLVPGASYFVKVRAVGKVDAVRRKKWSEVARLTTTEYSPPEAPSEPKCTSEPKGEQHQNTLQLELAKPASVDEITAMELAIQRVTMEGEDEPDWEYHKLGPDDLKWTISDLLPGQCYRCMLRAKAEVWGPWSGVMDASTSAAPAAPPFAPEEAASTAGPEENLDNQDAEALDDHTDEARRLFQKLSQMDLSKPKHRDVINHFLAVVVKHLRSRQEALEQSSWHAPDLCASRVAQWLRYLRERHSQVCPDRDGHQGELGI